MVKFKAKIADRDLIMIITTRAFKEQVAGDMITLAMDLEAVHCNDVKLDFKKLAGANTFNFVHDIVGIQSHINRKTGKLENCFLPRCVARVVKKGGSHGN